MSGTLVFHPEWISRLRAAGWDRYERIVALRGSEIDDGNLSRVIVVVPPPACGIPEIVLKRYRYSVLGRLRTWLTVPKAKREFENLRRAREGGLDAPEALVCGYRRVLGFEIESFLLTVRIPGARSLREVSVRIGRGDESLPAFPRMRRVIEDFAGRLSRFHVSGQFLHTPYFKNILWGQVGGEDRLFVIDIPWGNNLLGRIFFRGAVLRDLAALEKGAKRILPRSARLRFLKVYLGKSRLDEESRSIARRVHLRSRSLSNETRLSRALMTVKLSLRIAGRAFLGILRRSASKKRRGKQPLSRFESQA